MHKDQALQRPPVHPLFFTWFVSRNVRRWAVAGIVAVIIAESLASGMVYLLKLLVDAVTGIETGGSFEQVWLLAMLYPVFYMVMQAAWRTSGFCGMRWATGASSQVVKDLFSYMTAHSTSYFHNRFAGALTNNINNATRGVDSIIASFLWQFLSLGINFIASIIIAWLASWQLAVILTGWVALFLVLNFFFVRKRTPLSIAAANAGSTLRGKMVDTASNIMSVQNHSHHSYEHGYLASFIDAWRGKELQSWQYSEWVLVYNGIMQAVFYAIMLAMSVYLLQLGSITIGAMVMIITMVTRLQESLFFIGQKMNEFASNYGQIQEGLHELLLPHEITDVPEAKDLEIKNGTISFDHVSFRFGERHIFEDLHLHIPGGQKVGIVGTSGAGKTTFVSLLLRQYELDGGEIFIDDQPIHKLTQSSLRRAIALVPQDTSLFHRTIGENIGYGRLEATKDDIEQAARLARAHSFIEVMPEGYKTHVGERGVKLSGGQRQRIAIARAILKNAPILVLDEATSALDSESEVAIQEALHELMEGKTVIAIAHRLSTLRAMDRILVIDKGQILEDGSHEELTRANGVYASLWKHQVQGFIA